MAEQVTGRLENWVVDATYQVVWGNLYEDIHKRWPEGTHIHTSSIPDGVQDLKEGMTIRTLNSTYLLGKKMKVKS